MLMKQSWMDACLKSPEDVRNDYKHRVETVKYKDVVYNSVVAWHQSHHQPGVPYLRDVCFGYVEWPVNQAPLADMRRGTFFFFLSSSDVFFRRQSSTAPYPSRCSDALFG